MFDFILCEIIFGLIAIWFTFITNWHKVDLKNEVE